MSRKKNVDYQSYIDNIWLNGYSDETRGRFGQTARELGGQRDNPHLLFEINDKDTEKAFRTILQSQNNGGEIAVFKQGDILIINGHGTKRSGKLIHHGKTCNPQTIISQLENSGMISNDIKEIFTLNCYGGKQSSFTTKSGIKVQSAHTSTNPIIGKLGYQVDNDIATKIYMGISLQNGDVNDAFKNAVLRNQNERISLHTSPQEITDLINEAVNRALYDTDENGQMFMRQAAPSEDTKSNQPIKTVESVNDTSDSMTPSFIDENGNIKDEYIINNTDTLSKNKLEVFNTKQGNSKYYTQDQLDALFNFKHKRTAMPTNETKYKETWGNQYTDYTNFDEFQKIGGNKSFAKFTVNKEHQEIIKKYWDLLNKVDGNVLIARQESSKIFNEIENEIINQYINDIHKAFTEYATNGEHNSINYYMKNNMEFHNKLVNHYFKTGEILDISPDVYSKYLDDGKVNASSIRQELLSSESSKKPYKQLKAIRGPRLKKKINESSPVDIPKIQTQQDIVDEVVKKTKSNMVVKPVSNAGQESIEKVAKSIPSGGAGKYVALALGALAVTSVISNSNKKKEGPIQTRRSFNEKTRMTYDVPINDPQAMQMAQAMSQYRYGTRLPGFN